MEGSFSLALSAKPKREKTLCPRGGWERATVGGRTSATLNPGLSPGEREEAAVFT